MTMNGIVARAEKQGEALFQADPKLASDLRTLDVVTDLELARSFINSAISKIEDYPYQNKEARAEITEYLSKDYKRIGQSITKYRRSK